MLSVVNAQGKFWYQSDALGSTYAMANGAGAVVARGGYDVFGASVAISGNVGQPFGFTGREHELDSGLVYARNRYLNVAAGRWDRPDPFGDVDGVNRYQYAHEGPTRFTDPTGTMVLPPIPPVLIAAVFAAGVGAAFGAISALIGGLSPNQGAFWESVAVSALTAAFTVALPFGPGGSALAGMLVAGISNAISQMVSLNAGPVGGKFNYVSLGLAMASGLVAGFFGGLLGPNSGLASFATELESYMIPTIVSLVLGGPADVMNAGISKAMAMYQALHAEDAVPAMCYAR